RVPAAVDRSFELHRQVPRRFLRAALGADGGGRAAHDRVQGPAPGGIIGGLTLHERLSGLEAAEDVGRKLAAGVALDAGLIDEQVARSILRDRELAPRHHGCLTGAPPPRFPLLRLAIPVYARPLSMLQNRLLRAAG